MPPVGFFFTSIFIDLLLCYILQTSHVSPPVPRLVHPQTTGLETTNFLRVSTRHRNTTLTLHILTLALQSAGRLL
jgi:hypothetical protein